MPRWLGFIIALGRGVKMCLKRRQEANKWLILQPLNYMDAYRVVYTICES